VSSAFYATQAVGVLYLWPYPYSVLDSISRSLWVTGHAGLVSTDVSLLSYRT